MRMQILVAAAAASFVACPGAEAAERQVKEFFGIWLYEDQAHFKCDEAEGEGPWVTIGPAHYSEEPGDPCEDVEMFVEGNRLRVSASCAGDETGFSAVVKEYELIDRSTLRDRERTYKMCVGPLPDFIATARK